VVSSQIPFACSISSEVGRTFENTVDFYVDGELEWMIEFVSVTEAIHWIFAILNLNTSYQKFFMLSMLTTVLCHQIYQP